MSINFDPTGTSYQLEKYIKHTIPSAQSHAISIFDMSEGKSFKDFITNTLASGCVEIDDQGRKNIIWIAGKKQGYIWANNALQGDEDGVKVVLSDNPDRIHAFPIASSSLEKGRCMSCRAPIFY